MGNIKLKKYNDQSGGLLCRIDYPDMKAPQTPYSEAFEYYDDGNLRYHTDRGGKVTEYAYDGDGRLSSIKLPDNAGFISYYYDGKGNLERIIDKDGSRIEYGYDGYGRPAVESKYSGGGTMLYRHKFCLITSPIITNKGIF